MLYRGQTPKNTKPANPVLATPSSATKANFQNVQRVLYKTDFKDSVNDKKNPILNKDNNNNNSPRATPASLFSFNRKPLKVFLRIRPLQDSEKKKNTFQTVIPKDEKIIILRPPDTQASNAPAEQEFSFSRVMSQASQEEVYDQTAKPLLMNSLMNRQNSLLFAYGCTSSGKTYTILGNNENPGLIPQIARTAFHSFEQAQDPNMKSPYALPLNPQLKYHLVISYAEIYNEKIFDLLTDEPVSKRTPLKIQDRNGRPIVEGLQELRVSTLQELEKLIKKGSKRKIMASTECNQDSSRSHSLITFQFVSYPKNTTMKEVLEKELMYSARLTVVDLAGSERAKKTQNNAKGLTEAANINKSLLVLGRCMSALYHNQTHSNPKPVPSRESKLTRLFQDFFERDGEVSMIVNVGPSAGAFEETAQVLKFSALARQITTGKTPDLRRQRSVLARPDEAAMGKQDIQAETQIREECALEFSTKLLEIEEFYQQKRIREMNNMEQMYNQRIENLIKYYETQLEGENSDEESETKVSSQEVEQLREELEELRSENKRFKIEKENQCENEFTREEVQKIELTKLEKAYNTQLTKQEKEYKKENEHLKNELNKEISKLQTKLKEENQVIQELKQKISSTSKTQKSNITNEKENEKKRKELEKQKNNLEKQLNELQQQFEETEKKLKDTQAQLNKAKNQFSEEISNLKLEKDQELTYWKEQAETKSILLKEAEIQLKKIKSRTSGLMSSPVVYQGTPVTKNLLTNSQHSLTFSPASFQEDDSVASVEEEEEIQEMDIDEMQPAKQKQKKEDKKAKEKKEEKPSSLPKKKNKLFGIFKDRHEEKHGLPKSTFSPTLAQEPRKNSGNYAFSPAPEEKENELKIHYPTPFLKKSGKKLYNPQQPSLLDFSPPPAANNPSGSTPIAARLRKF